MEQITASIIIPTYNRKDLLMKTLEALNEQSYKMEEVEVIIIDDCSPVNPEQAVLDLNTKYALRFYREKNNIGQGLVRNRAIKLARGKYLFFIGDDTVPLENLMKEHMDLHAEYNGIAVLGQVLWSPELRSEFMNYIEKIQFHYQNIKDKNNVKLHFYTSNISLEKRWFDNEGYSDKFNNYGLEDIELGHRLESKGLRVIYNPEAIVYHVHTYTYEQFCDRMRKVGKSAVIFASLHPELKRKYILPFHSILKAGSFVLSRKPIKHISNKLYWFSSFVYHYLIGIGEELRSSKE